MQLRKTRPGGVAFVHPQLLHIVSVGGDERTPPRQPVRPVERLALGLGPNWDLTGLAALGPGVFEHQVVALVGIARDEFDRFFPAEPECGLQFKAHPYIVVANLGECLSHKGLGFTLLGDEDAVRNAVMVIRSGDDILAIHFKRPPPQGRHPVLDGGNREFFREPMLGQRFHVFRFQGAGFQLTIPERMQLVRNARQNP